MPPVLRCVQSRLDSAADPERPAVAYRKAYSAIYSEIVLAMLTKLPGTGVYDGDSI